MLCSVCRLESSDKDDLLCSLCKKVYHSHCVGIDSISFGKMRTETKKNWKCGQCKGKSQKEQSKVGAGEIQPIIDINDIAAIIKRSVDDSISMHMSNIEKKIDQSVEKIKSDFSILRYEMLDLKNSVQFLSQEYDHIKSNTNENQKLCSDLKKECDSLRKTVHQLEEEIHTQQQYSRRENILILGVPVSQNECLMTLLQKISEIIGISFDEKDVSVAHRLPASQQSASPPIVVKFARRAARDTWWEKFRRASTEYPAIRRGIPLSLIGFPRHEGNISFVEHITGKTRDLLFKIRDEAKVKNFKFVWVRSGVIFVRKDEKAKAIKITSLEMFKKL